MSSCFWTLRDSRALGFAPAVEPGKDGTVVTGSSSAAPAMQPPERLLPRPCPGLPTECQLRQEGAPEGRWMCEVLTVQLLPLPRLDGGGTSRDDAIEGRGPRHSFLANCMPQFIENHSTDETKHLNPSLSKKSWTMLWSHPCRRGT